jgi:hypothetical protein
MARHTSHAGKNDPRMSKDGARLQPAQTASGRNSRIRNQWLANRNPNQLLPPSSREITDCTLYCFLLIADVYHVRQGGYISKALWKAWEGEIRHILDGRIFRREWEGLLRCHGCRKGQIKAKVKMCC